MLRVDPLEDRLTPAISLTVEYGQTFFTDPAARQTFDAVVSLYARALTGPATLIHVNAAPLAGGVLAQSTVGGGTSVVTFDPAKRWHFGATTEGLTATAFDFYSVAVLGYEGLMAIGVGDRDGDGVADISTAADNRHEKTFDGVAGVVLRSVITA